MGAYYAACLKYQKKRKWEKYTSWSCNYGAKLLEHSLFNSLYINEITKLILYKPAYFAWLCDYHKKEDRDDLIWNTVEGDESWNLRSDKEKRILYYVTYVNFTKKEFFDTYKLIHLIAKLVEEGDLSYFNVIIFRPRENPSRREYYPYVLHPLPLLTNSERDYMGGGDYEGNYLLRKRWYRDLIVAVSPIYSKIFEEIGFEDITAKVPVPVGDDSCYQNEEFKYFASFVNFTRYYGAKSISEAIIRSYKLLGFEFSPRSESKVIKILKDFGYDISNDVLNSYCFEYKKSLCQSSLF